MKRLLLIFIFLFPFQPFIGNCKDNPPKSLVFKHLTTQDGLSTSWVKTILRDHKGYLWIGTAEGINRYDGNTIKTYKYSASDTCSINHNNINLIYEDKKHNIWVGTQEGLNVYHPQTDGFIRIRSIHNYVSSCVQISDHKFIVGTAGGLWVLDPNTFQSKQINSKLYVEKIIQDKFGHWLVASRSGLFVIKPDSYSLNSIIHSTNKANEHLDQQFHSLLIDSYGQIWLGSHKQGLYRLNYSKPDFSDLTIDHFFSQTDHPSSISKGAIYCIGEDDHRNLWIGVENGGLNILNLTHLNPKHPNFIHYYHHPVDPSSIGSNSIHAFFRDNLNTIWLGTYGNGVSYYSALLQKFELLREIPQNGETMNNNFVTAIEEDEDCLYIGTDNGLKVVHRKTNKTDVFKTVPKQAQSIGSDAVMAIFRDSRKHLYVGTWGGGLNIFHQNTKTFTRKSGAGIPLAITNGNIVNIIEDRCGNLWMASMGDGLIKLDRDRKQYTCYRSDFTNRSISCDWVNAIIEGNKDNFWLSTTEGLEHFNAKTGIFRVFKHDRSNPKSISYNGAICLYKDSRKHIWIGTSNGLNLFVPKDSSFVCFKEEDGLPSNIIKAITEDNYGNLWLTTNNGISKFEKAIDLPEKALFKNFNLSDGLQADEFNNRSIYKNKDGLIYMGGPKGYNVFNPRMVYENTCFHKIVFTNLLIFNKPVKAGQPDSPLSEDIGVAKEIRLSREQSVFTLEFATLNLLAPSKNQYQYVLEGFDRQWNQAGKKHAATYTNLNPGTYIFRVKACNNDGIWNEEGISIKVIVLPAWWQTWIAKAVYLLAIFVVIYYYRRHTIKSVNLRTQLKLELQEKAKLEELNHLKQQFFTNVSHELRTPLTLIIGPLKQIVDRGRGSEQLNTVYRNASRLKVLVDQIMDFSKIENQMMKLQLVQRNVIEVIESSISNFTDLAGQKNISLIFSSDATNCWAEVDEDKLDKIITNIISNAIKNTPAGGSINIKLETIAIKSSLKLLISDTGQGIPPEEIDFIFDRFFTSNHLPTAQAGTGIGLNLTHKLVEMLKGTISVDSQIGKGSTFEIIFQLDFKVLDPLGFEKIFKSRFQPKVLRESSIKSTPGQHHDRTILIIDDNEEICEYIASTLCNEYNILTETDPAMGLQVLTDQMPDLIISDVMMPGMDGFELCSKIKKDLRFCHIPVILLTAKVTITDHIVGYETGADDYVYKPFDSALLKARVKNLIQKKETIRHQFIGQDGIINSKAEVNSLDFSFIDQIMGLIQGHYSDPEFNVNNIIDQMAMSRSVFYSKFKALSNQSINELIVQFRLKKAEEMLRTSEHSIGDIAWQSGFSDPAYFSRVFKAKYQLSPKEYKHQKVV